MEEISVCTHVLYVSLSLQAFIRGTSEWPDCCGPKVMECQVKKLVEWMLRKLTKRRNQ